MSSIYSFGQSKKSSSKQLMVVKDKVLVSVGDIESA